MGSRPSFVAEESGESKLTPTAIVTHGARESEFERMCKSASTADEIYAITTIVEICTQNASLFPAEDVYNRHIGWGLPSRAVCEEVAAFWKSLEDPTVRLVDVGAGSGIFCKMFHDAGIPAANLVALDRSTPDVRYRTSRVFWQVVHDDTYQVSPRDIFFLAWGTSDLEEPLLSYIARGGSRVVILGERDDEINFSSFYFYDNVDWEMVATCSLYEHLTFNVRKK